MIALDGFIGAQVVVVAIDLSGSVGILGVVGNVPKLFGGAEPEVDTGNREVGNTSLLDPDGNTLKPRQRIATGSGATFTFSTCGLATLEPSSDLARVADAGGGGSANLAVNKTTSIFVVGGFIILIRGGKYFFG